jgi:hypothetical protein
VTLLGNNTGYFFTRSENIVNKFFKTSFLSLFLFALPITAAPALEQANVPPKFPIPWGARAVSPFINSIPVTSQIGIVNCRASLNDGFPPLTFVPSTAGGCPPFGADFNGILKQVSQWSQWQSAGGPVFYDSAFATGSGGYPSGAKIASAVTPGTVWMSTADNNATNPDTAAATNWVQDPGQVPIGTPIQSLSTAIPAGYVSANGTTIGNASSNATGRASADTQFLFNFVWNNCPSCTDFTSMGTVSTRSTPWADFAANKAIAVPNMNGSTLMGADSQNGSTSTRLANVPITSGSRTSPLSLIGENLHTLLVAELATHNHGVNDPGHTHSAPANGGPSNGAQHASSGNAPGVTINTNSATTGITIQNAGSNTPHNTVPLSTVVYWDLKL